MQPFAPVTAADMLEPVQNMLVKIEVWDGAAWRNLASLGGRDYIKTYSVSMGGAKQSTTPTAATWSAVLDNPGGIFHPKHPTSSWANLLRTGREVRISLGAIYGAIAHYYQRLIGFMDAPSFDHGAHEVSIGGQDYTQLLTSTILGDQDPIAESGSGSGSTEVDDQINGPLHWGARASFNSVATGGSGSELYDEGDACEIGVGEADNVTNWSAGPSGSVSSEGPAQESNYMLRLTRSEDWNNTGDEYAENTNVASLTAGQQYICTFWARCVYNSSDSGGYARLQFKQGSSIIFTEYVGGTDWAAYTAIFTAPTTAALILRYYSCGKYSMAGDYVELDEISIKTYDPDTWEQYSLPPECTGPYFVTYNGDPIGQGYQDTELSWHYDESTKTVYLAEDIQVENGVDNLKVYYYTAQNLDNVLADILAYCGLYANRAAALADMDYTPTGIILDRVWLDPNTTALMAVAKICERANYRFYFSYDGKPNFHPAPVADSIDWIFPEWGDIQALSEAQDDGMIRNHITIEGCQRNMYQLTRDDKASDKWKGSAEDATSILAYLEKTHNIQNHLFQDQASINSMAAELLAEFKDPKWYADLTTFSNPVPLEIGDTIEFLIELEPPDEDGSLSGALAVSAIGIIRDIKIQDFQVVYKLELVDELWSAGSASSVSVASVSPTSISSVSASPSESPSGSPEPESESLSPLSYELDVGDDGVNINVPAGYTQAVIECWGGGGTGYGFTAPGFHGGGAGGGAYSKKTLAVSSGQVLHCDIPSGNAKDCWVTRSSITVCLAKSGNDGDQMAGGQGGQASAGTGDTKYSGGNGYYTEAGFVGCGGGSSAGTASNGTSAVGQPGGNAPAGGGDGGNGGARYSDGEGGDTPGGGGGSAGDDGSDDRLGGGGGNGQIHIVLT